MAELSDAAARLMGAFGAVQQATNDRASTAEVYQAIRDAYTSQGFPVPSLQMQAVNELRRYAADMRNTADRFNRAPDDTGITADYISRAPWSKDMAAQAAAPEFQIRFQHTTTDEIGNEVTAWRSLILPGSLPLTKAALLAQVDAAAASFADEYGVGHVGVGALQLLVR